MDFLKHLLQWASLRIKIWFNDFVSLFPSARHAYIFLATSGFLLVLAIAVLSFSSKWPMLLTSEPENPIATTGEPTVSIEGVLPQRQEPSARGTGVTTKSSEYVNLKEKLVQERRILAVKAVLSKSGIALETTDNLVTATMVQLEVEVQPGVLPNGTRADLSVSWTDLRSQLITPGRFRYLISFKSSGQNELVISSKELPGGSKKASFNVR